MTYYKSFLSSVYIYIYACKKTTYTHVKDSVAHARVRLCTESVSLQNAEIAHNTEEEEEDGDDEEEEEEE